MHKPNIVIYTTGYCPYCFGAKQVLKERGLTYSEIRIDREPGMRREMEERAQRRSVPQVFIDDYHVGGHDDLVALDRSGQLDQILAELSIAADPPREPTVPDHATTAVARSTIAATPGGRKLFKYAG